MMIFSLSVFSQRVDTVITTPIFTSYYSYGTHTPLFVTYKLYKGGGDVSRVGMKFPRKLVESYKGNGYDIGHMCNAEDMASNRSNVLTTFDSINQLPQLPTLNRGIWSSYEHKFRVLSQTDSLFIICGGFQFFNKINGIGVPKICFKVVKNLKTNDLFFYIFDNVKSCNVITMQKNNFLLFVYDDDLRKLIKDL